MLILLPCKLGLAASPMIRDSDENNALIADKNLMNYSSSSLEYSEMLWKEKERETISEPFMVIHLGNYLEADNLMLMAFFFFPVSLSDDIPASSLHAKWAGICFEIL